MNHFTWSKIRPRKRKDVLYTKWKVFLTTPHHYYHHGRCLWEMGCREACGDLFSGNGHCRQFMSEYKILGLGERGFFWDYVLYITLLPTSLHFLAKLYFILEKLLEKKSNAWVLSFYLFTKYRYRSVLEISEGTISFLGRDRPWRKLNQTEFRIFLYWKLLRQGKFIDNAFLEGVPFRYGRSFICGHW